MSVATHRARIKVVLDSVTDKGKTHDYKRWASTWGDFLDLFKTTIDSTVQIRGWEITFQGFTQTETSIGRTGNNIVRVYTWRLDGYLGLDDSATTDKTLADLAEDVVEALDGDAVLNERSITLYREPANLAMDMRIFGSVLCNHAEITLVTAELM